jgi:two-component system chemotaxis response regulator CheB
MEDLPEARRLKPGLVCIGGSAGAVEPLREIVRPLPRDFPLPIVVVIHVPRTMRGGLAELVAAAARLPAVEASDHMPLERGRIFIAPPDYHLLIEPPGRLALSTEEPVRYCRPSIDVLFESAAIAFAERVTAVLLSGANDDGAEGLRAVQARGGRTIVQAPETAVVPAMPLAALAQMKPDQSVPPSQIASILTCVG